MSSEQSVDAEAFNLSMRKFLKQLGVTSQQAIEAAVREAAAKGAPLDGRLAVKAVVTIEEIGLTHEVSGAIELQADAEPGDS